MSWLTLTAVTDAPNPAQSSKDRDDIGHISGAGVDRAAEQVDKQHHQHDGEHQRGQQRIEVAAGQADAADGHRQRVAHHRHGPPPSNTPRRWEQSCQTRGSAPGQLAGLSPGSAHPADRSGSPGRRGRGRWPRIRASEDVIESGAVHGEPLRPRSGPGQPHPAGLARVAAVPSVGTPMVRLAGLTDDRAAGQGSARRPPNAVWLASVRSSRCPATCVLSLGGGALGERRAGCPGPRCGRGAGRRPPGTGWSGRRSRRLGQAGDDLHMVWRLGGSRPVVGSSRKITGGRAHQAGRQVEPAAHAARIGLDPPARRRRQVEPGEQLGRALAGRRPGKPGQPAHHPQVLLAGQHLVQRRRTGR